jgi:ATP-dependent helicase Lhr and Lhr-like helicase
VKKVLLSLDPDNLRPLVVSAIEKSSMARIRSLQVAKKLGMIRKDVDYRQISMARLNEMLRGTIVFDEVIREILQGKMDIQVVSGFLKELKSGALELKVSRGFSPLCLDKLERMASLDLISPKKPDAEILNLFKQRRVELVCLNCGAWSDSFTIESLPDFPKCPKCTARLLALNKSSENDALKIVKKFLRGWELSKAESAYYKHLRFSADTVLTYGKHGIIALGGRGIGPRSAVRVLSRMHKEDGKFLKDLLEQERLYAKNKRFWA